MRASKINIEGTPVPKQQFLFEGWTEKRERYQPGPKIHLEREWWDTIFEHPSVHPITGRDQIGLDFEFDIRNLKPTIVGVANTDHCVGLQWEPWMAEYLEEAADDHNVELVAYSTASADKSVLDKQLGYRTPLKWWGDGMLTHYLANQDFCKTPGKGEDDDDAGVMGLMNLWTATSCVVDISQWKICRGRVCDGPCPTHEVHGYCGQDAWGGLLAEQRNMVRIEKHGGSVAFYRELLELTEMTYAMQCQGVRVDIPYAMEMDADMGEKKQLLFPRVAGGFGPTAEWEWFNPMSPKQGLEYFSKRGILIQSGNKKDVQIALTKAARARGYDSIKHLTDDLESPLLELNAWYQFKSEGKGLQAWFKPEGKRQNVWEETPGVWFAHPRFIVPATSTGRLSSSFPNWQNIPARGWGELVRRAVIARDRAHRLLKSDYGQLELRMCLYLAGVDPRTIQGDAFDWLISKAPDEFADAAKLIGHGMKPRDVAKRVSHAANYLAGFVVLSSEDLMKPYYKNMINNGALRVYLKKYGAPFDWEFGGGVVAFSGANLADTMFGSKSWENRKKALEVQEDLYFKNFPMLRQLQQKELAVAEERGYVVSRTGRFLELHGTAEDNAKIIMAFHGQGTSADFVQEVMLRYWRWNHDYKLPLMQVHDELDWDIPRDWNDSRVKDFVVPMMEESERLPGFIAPITAKIGENWNEKDMKTAWKGGLF
jgi:hypothetical protein